MDESDAMEFYLERAEIIEIDGGRPRPDTNMRQSFSRASLDF
ncbi:hypothetical protein [Paraburkholderia panacisoli]|nr:hypothetical protein [Paraburkholderia panacisoli]